MDPTTPAGSWPRRGLAAAIVMRAAGLLADRLGAARVVPVGPAILTAGTIWMTSLAAHMPAWQVALMLGVRGLGMGFTMMPAMSAASVTLKPEQIARAPSVGNVVQRVASGFGVAVMVTILAIESRPTCRLARSVRGSRRRNRWPHLPVPLKSLLLAQVAKGYQ